MFLSDKNYLAIPMFSLQNYEIIQDGHSEKEQDDAGTQIDDDPSEFEVVAGIAAVADTYARSRSRSAKKKDMFMSSPSPISSAMTLGVRETTMPAP
jgi:hypothetical protein